MSISLCASRHIVKRPGRLTEVEVVVLGIADGEKEADGVDDGWWHTISNEHLNSDESDPTYEQTTHSCH